VPDIVDDGAVSESLPPPGWYADPSTGVANRRWNRQEWTPVTGVPMAGRGWFPRSLWWPAGLWPTLVGSADGEPSGCAEVVKLDILGYSLNSPKLSPDAIDQSETVNQVEPLLALVSSSATSHA
jgi:hypothetical protein